MTMRTFLLDVLKLIATGIFVILILVTVIYLKAASLFSSDVQDYFKEPINISALYMQKKKLDLSSIYAENWDNLMVVTPYVPYLDGRFDLFWVRFFLFDIFLDGTQQYDHHCDLVFFKGRKPIQMVSVFRNVIDFYEISDPKVFAREQARFSIEKNEHGEFIAVSELQKKK